MKKKIAIIFFIGAIASVSMGFRSQSTGDGLSGDTQVQIVKGVVTNSDRDKYWENVTFGLSALNSHDYISYVEIFDRKGRSIGEVDDPQESDQRGSNHHDITWYSIDLNDFFISGNFTLEVHVQSGRSGSHLISTLTMTANSAGAPIDPDETILIVKYP